VSITYVTVKFPNVVSSPIVYVTFLMLVQDFLVDVLRKSRQWYIRCILPQPPYKLPGALMHHLAELEDSLEPPAMGHIEIPLVRDQIRRGNIVKAARIFKQGVCVMFA